VGARKGTGTYLRIIIIIIIIRRLITYAMSEYMTESEARWPNLSCFNHYSRLPARWALAFLIACHSMLLLHAFCYYCVFSLWQNKYDILTGDAIENRHFKKQRAVAIVVVVKCSNISISSSSNSRHSYSVVVMSSWMHNCICLWGIMKYWL